MILICLTDGLPDGLQPLKNSLMVTKVFQTVKSGCCGAGRARKLKSSRLSPIWKSAFRLCLGHVSSSLSGTGKVDDVPTTHRSYSGSFAVRRSSYRERQVSRSVPCSGSGSRREVLQARLSDCGRRRKTAADSSAAVSPINLRPSQPGYQTLKQTIA